MLCFPAFSIFFPLTKALVMNNETTCGLVVCGGESRRMGKDKAFIEYHGEAQLYRVYRLLRLFCDRVLMSCATTQAAHIDQGYNILVDEERYRGRGPATALLTAAHRFPENNFLIAGCDYPFLDAEELSSFAALIDEHTHAAAFFNTTVKLYEPLLGYYSAEAAKQFSIENADEPVSLQNFLMRHEAMKYYPRNPAAAESIDTPVQETIAREKIRHLKNHQQ
jgi:molybdopterin-guanine dinucleotide biosynthesis protein A